MPVRFPSSETQLQELEELIESFHPLWAFDTVEEERLDALLWDLSERVGLPYFSWSPVAGLVRHGPQGGRPPGTETLAKCLAFIEQANYEAIFHLKGVAHSVNDPEVVTRLKEIARRYFEHRGVITMSGSPLELSQELNSIVSYIDLKIPTVDEYHTFINSVLQDISLRKKFEITLDEKGVRELLTALHGLPLLDVKKIITQAVIRDGKLSQDDMQLVFDAKRRLVERDGLLEFFSHKDALDDVGGLEHLKSWLKKRQRAFQTPEEAKQFGLEPPKGLLLIGVQGCGKSLCAKAIASEWKLPLIKLDPSRLYQKYFGESERSLRKAIHTAEAMAPVVLWVDELEKAFSEGKDDSGTSQRILGTMLGWLQEKKEPVFLIATANDISKLPPELLRKGRFDEIFFIDLPNARIRKSILELHLKKRNYQGFNLDEVVEKTEGFSGAELEQLIVSALYSAFENKINLTVSDLIHEANATKPLSVTMSEKIDDLRKWAHERAVLANEHE